MEKTVFQSNRYGIISPLFSPLLWLLLLMASGCQKQPVEPLELIEPTKEVSDEEGFVLNVGISNGGLRAVNKEGFTIYSNDDSVEALDHVDDDTKGNQADDLVHTLVVLAYNHADGAYIADKSQFDYIYDPTTGQLKISTMPDYAVDLYFYANIMTSQGFNVAELLSVMQSPKDATDALGQPVGANPILRRAGKRVDRTTLLNLHNALLSPLGSAVEETDATSGKKRFVSKSASFAPGFNTGALISSGMVIDPEQKIGLPMFTVVKGVKKQLEPGSNRKYLTYRHQYTDGLDTPEVDKELHKIILERSVVKLTVNVEYETSTDGSTNTTHYISGVGLSNVPEYIAVRPDLMRRYSLEGYIRTVKDFNQATQQEFVKDIYVDTPLQSLSYTSGTGATASSYVSYYRQDPNLTEAIKFFYVKKDQIHNFQEVSSHTIYLPEVLATDDTQALKLLYTISEKPQPSDPLFVTDSDEYYAHRGTKSYSQDIGFILPDDAIMGQKGNKQLHRNHHYTVTLKLSKANDVIIDVLVNPWREAPDRIINEPVQK